MPEELLTKLAEFSNSWSLRKEMYFHWFRFKSFKFPKNAET
jgi:hypothetical protein